MVTPLTSSLPNTYVKWLIIHGDGRIQIIQFGAGDRLMWPSLYSLLGVAPKTVMCIRSGA